MTNEPFKGSVEKMLANKGSVYHEPYVAVRLPFRVAAEMPTCFEAIHPAYLPYVHQQKAFERLTGDDGRSTLVATGTGSGKTECFLYPILEYCYQHRGERGIKALIIYPMNALATDQAKRIAELIHGSDELRGNVNVDHLRATVSEVPVPDADYRKQYLVIYDSVPGGTGYLKQLMHEKNALIEIFEKALHVMENCSCKDDPQKDGCYHCLYA